MRRRVLLTIVAAWCIAPRSDAFPDAASGVRAQPRPAVQRIPQFDNDRATSWKSVIPSQPNRHSIVTIAIAL